MHGRGGVVEFSVNVGLNVNLVGSACVVLLQIETHKLDFSERAEARIGSKDNMNYGRQVGLT